MTVATRGDWKADLMPDDCEAISIARRYSFEEFERLRAGVVPRSMDDRWFIYYEEPWLFLHRSWTGYCIFRVRFERVNDGMAIAQAFVNRKPEQYRGAEDDDVLLGTLLDSRAGRDVRKQVIAYVRNQQGKGLLPFVGGD